jgi:hypothetical protein
MGADVVTLRPHPDVERMTSAELRAAIAEAEEQMKLPRELEDGELESWFVCERRLLEAGLARRNGQRNLTSDYRDPLSEVKFEREVNAAVLQAEVTAQGIPAVTFKPFLGRDGYVVKGWSHLVAAFPKTGKTELMVRAVADWPDDRILYVTEEPKSVWQARLLKLPPRYNHLGLFFGLGVQQEEIFERIKGGTETVFILDTIRNLLGLGDETDNSAMARL